MADEEYDNKYIPSQLDLFEDNPNLKNYLQRPVWTFPKLCALDSNLNADLLKAVDMHGRITEMLYKIDQMKFFMVTPKEGTLTYPQTFHLVRGVSPTNY